MDVLVRRWGLLVRRSSLCVGLSVGAVWGTAWAADTVPYWRPPQYSVPIRDPDHIFNRSVVTYKDLKTRNVVMQQRDYSCGAAALATLMRYYWGDNVAEIDILKEIEAMLTADELRDRVQNGLSIADLRRTAVKFGYQSAIGTMKVDKLRESKVPVIVAIEQNKYNHFVVVRGFRGDFIFLADPILGNVRMPASEFADLWIKNTLLVAVKPGQTQSSVSQLHIYPIELCPSGQNRQYLIRVPERTFGTR